MKSTYCKNSNPITHLKNKVTEIEMTYRHKIKAKDRPTIQSSQNAFHVFKQVWSAQIGLLEECHLLLLDRSSKLIGHTLISKGSFHATLVDPKVIFACALKARASSIILAHNHPSGNLKPSFEDITLTKKLMQGGKLLDMPIFDHLILTPEDSYFSFCDEGLLELPPF